MRCSAARTETSLTFGVSDALNTISIGSGVREEDGIIYNEVVFFGERHKELTQYTPGPHRPPAGPVRDVARGRGGVVGGAAGLHARARSGGRAATGLLHLVQPPPECRLRGAVEGARGREAAGLRIDHRGRRLANARHDARLRVYGRLEARANDGHEEGSSSRRHKIGIKVVLWYAVPFVGKNTALGPRFKDKSLRFSETTAAYTLDPRYPEVRQDLDRHLRKALRDWNLDGFKLDFIDRFVADEQHGARSLRRPRLRLSERGRRPPDDRHPRRAEEMNPM